MALIENRRLHRNYCYICDSIHIGACWQVTDKVKMKQDLTGGYCPRCDTVWASPGVCRCDPTKISQDEMNNAVETYTYNGPKQLNERSVFETEIWNKAIEAAALKVEGEAVGQLDGFYVHDCNEHAANIRKLKR